MSDTIYRQAESKLEKVIDRVQELDSKLDNFAVKMQNVEFSVNALLKNSLAVELNSLDSTIKHYCADARAHGLSEQATKTLNSFYERKNSIVKQLALL